MSFASFFQSIPTLAHTFLGYIVKGLKAIGKYEPTIADALSHSMNYIEPLAVDVVTVEFGTGLNCNRHSCPSQSNLFHYSEPCT
jgi:hypothetical protein